MSNNIFHNNFKNLNYSNSYEYIGLPRYRWYNYKEGFSPKLVEEALKTVELEKEDYILDPFNGNGTVTLTASLNNINSIGIEVNPFVAFVSEIKLSNEKHSNFEKHIDSIINAVHKGRNSELLKFSTFSEFSNKSKWLFNSDVLKSFEAGWIATKSLSKSIQGLFQLALIGAAMDNCNAVKDGKCLKYRPNWGLRNFDKYGFAQSLKNRLDQISIDLKESKIENKASIINGDSRIAINNIEKRFKLCLTSPPYLNSFDYTDIYRPELFLGKFILNNNDLRNLRFKTVRSHMEIKLPLPTNSSFGDIYSNALNKINEAHYFWDKQIPIMIQSYFEDMENILIALKSKALKNGQLWLVVANSVYAGTELPVDLILTDIGTRNGWKLIRIEVLRNIQRRKTKYNGDINSIRESLIIFENN
jgi:DNA modification methylase